MTPLEKQLARAKSLGAESFSYRWDGGGYEATMLADDGKETLGKGWGITTMLAATAAINDAEERATIGAENKRDRQTRERPTGPSSTTSTTEA